VPVPFFGQKGNDMTINEILERVDRNNPNAFDKATKTGWIAQLDGKIALDVMLMDIAETEQFRYRIPEALEMTPLVGFPHDDLYELWLNVKIHAAQGETERYQNALLLYNAAYKNYVRWFAHTYAPAQDGTSAVTYYITAYGLAVQQGYGGSLEEWLESLKGDPGNPGTVAFEDLTPEQIAMLRGSDGMSAYALAVRQGYKGGLDEWLESLRGLSAYQVAVHQGFEGDEESWLESLKGTTPERGTDYWTAEDIREIQKYIDSGITQVEAVLVADGWSEDAPYTQTIPVAAVKADKPPHICPVYSGEMEDNEALADACAAVTYAKTEDGAVTFICLWEKPERDIPVRMEVRR